MIRAALQEAGIIPLARSKPGRTLAWVAGCATLAVFNCSHASPSRTVHEANETNEANEANDANDAHLCVVHPVPNAHRRLGLSKRSSDTLLIANNQSPQPTPARLPRSRLSALGSRLSALGSRLSFLASCREQRANAARSSRARVETRKTRLMNGRELIITELVAGTKAPIMCGSSLVRKPRRSLFAPQHLARS